MKTNGRSRVLDRIMSKMSPEGLAKTKNRMLIASKIANAMKRQGVTQKALAQKMGKQESEISEWLSGDRNFTIDTMTEICLALSINLLDTTIEKYSVAYEMPVCKSDKHANPYKEGKRIYNTTLIVSSNDFSINYNKKSCFA